jgi:hypothetical protein
MLFGCTGGDFSSSSVTVDNIRRVAPGMTERDVRNILGPPFEVVQDYRDDHRRMDFTRPGVGRKRWYPMLWIHLKAGRVASVYGKRYGLWGLDDEGVYLADDEGAPLGSESL